MLPHYRSLIQTLPPVQLAGQIKTQDDLAELSRQHLKLSVERVMVAELEDYLGYSMHAAEGQNTRK